jgi:hypothetical protein
MVDPASYSRFQSEAEDMEPSSYLKSLTSMLKISERLALEPNVKEPESMILKE